MTSPRLVSVIAFVLGLAATGAGDRAWPTPRVLDQPSAERSRSLPAFERFFIAGWVSPPADSTNPERIAELAEAGLDLMLPGLEDRGEREDNLRRLDLAAAHGIRCIVFDRRFARLRPFDPGTYGVLDSIVADYRHHPAFLAYYLADEPRAGFDTLARFQQLVRERDPEHSIYNNLPGRCGFTSHDQWVAHHREYLDVVVPKVLCNDHYEFLRRGDRNQFVENAAGLAAIARAAGLPFWSFIQLIEHGDYRAIGAGELRWQASTLLAYGARGIGYFTYWTPSPDPAIGWKPAIIDQRGGRTSWFPVVARFNRLLRAAGETTARLQWLAAVHAGSLPKGGVWFAPNEVVEGVEGRATLGYFSDSAGVPHVLVANADSLRARDVTLTLAQAARACVLDREHDSWSTARCVALQAHERLVLSLEAGSLALVKLEGATLSVRGGGVTLEVTPTPARGEARLSIARAQRAARVEIVDVGGRRVWSRPVAPGAVELRWSGERDSGGHAPAGLYFARVEDARGVAVDRLVWLGR